ncbi:MAG: lysoplasmalogenase [Myxococcales bacterium]|nr:lysoplasmalogenase [Myxococcales bacterium]
MSPFAAGCLLTGIALAGLLAAEWRESRAGIWLAKPLASLGFLVAALGAGALDDGAGAYGRWVFAALVLSFLGDVLLIPPATFLAGLVSFLLGHVAFAVAFGVRGIDPIWAAGSLPFAAVAVAGALRWLRPHVEPAMRMPVQAYVAVISAMVIAAVGAVGAGGPVAIALGALCFYVSDLAVARQRFVARTFWNKTWGLPLYYGAQLILASTVG